MTNYFTSGSWYVTPGREDQFIERWTEMVSWSRRTAMHQASLLRDNLSGHFLSFAEWDNPEQSRAWKRLLGSRSGSRPARRCATRPAAPTTTELPRYDWTPSPTRTY